ncbi:substrate-binding periplasmic protein [Spartinivicinus poritis]|uniref:Transporter substrate-binding domain-containing protein n=1 Tax=Spartinivicinus poritis TaxID=2994640 RepID=A0ABT5UCK0_9GAMM|nr:transporter substrate-binding domain-containing protein [Spartinivicinus sp. A2-2]MDE1464108.1 transporter substrate-binding domain-containing protein [Spartinivicinus sp. A2-2]
MSIMWISSAVAQTVSVAIAEWPPYAVKSLEDGGKYTKRVIDSLKSAGFKAHLVWHDNWLTAYNRTQVAKDDASIFWVCNPERADHFYYSNPFQVIQTVMFHLKSNNYQWNNLSDLKGRGPFGITTAYYYGDNFSEAAKKYNFNLREVRRESLVFNLLIYGRVNYVPTDILNGLELIERHVPKESQSYITYNPKPIEVGYLHLIIAKSHPQAKIILNGINKAIALLDDKYAKQLALKSLKDSCPTIEQAL